MSYYADDYYIGASLKLYGEYSELEIALLRRIIKPDWVVIDVGANIGALTVAFAEMAEEVYAFEPQPEKSIPACRIVLLKCSWLPSNLTHG